MEQLLHYIWMHKLLPSKTLTTTDGHEVVVLDPGVHNNNQGPDFSNAHIRMDGVLWVGNVEIHTDSSDWIRHKHHLDPVYNTTILHVVEHASSEAVLTQAGNAVPQVEVSIPDEIKANCEYLLTTTDYPRCHRFVGDIPAMKIHSWLDTLVVERLQARAERILHIMDECHGDWEKTAFMTLARNFGFGLNGDIFEMWARTISLSAAGKHRDNLLQIEAMFLGQAGLIDRIPDEAYKERLQTEYRFLSYKFTLPPPIPHSCWHYLRIRPQSFPDVRLRQLARLFHEGQCRMSSLLEFDTPDQLDNMLAGAGLSKTSRRLIMINTVAGLLFAHDLYHASFDRREKALELLQRLPGENNRILRQWQACGVNVSTAYDSQALIQLKKEYCDRGRCLDCRFGFEYISHIIEHAR